MTNTISQGKMLSLVFLMRKLYNTKDKIMEWLVSQTSHVKIALTFERPCHITAFLHKKLRGRGGDIPLKVILGWTSIHIGSVQAKDVQDSKK